MTAIIGHFLTVIFKPVSLNFVADERWIESPPVDEPSPLIYRLVISAAIAKRA